MELIFLNSFSLILTFVCTFFCEDIFAVLKSVRNSWLVTLNMTQFQGQIFHLLIAPSDSFTWFIFNLQIGKICTVLYIICSKQYSCVRSLNAEKPLVGVVAISARCETHSTLVPCWKSTAMFPTSHWPHPFSKLFPFSTPQTYTCDTILLSEDDIGTMNIFVI
jgi:hypothetical protein